MEVKKKFWRISKKQFIGRKKLSVESKKALKKIFGIRKKKISKNWQKALYRLELISNKRIKSGLKVEKISRKVKKRNRRKKKF